MGRAKGRWRSGKTEEYWEQVRKEFKQGWYRNSGAYSSYKPSDTIGVYEQHPEVKEDGD